MRRDRALKIVLVLVGLLFTAGIYPMVGGLVSPAGSDTGDTMMMSLYFVLGILLLIAVRNPSAHRSLIAFAAWSSFAHAAVMTILGFEMRSERTGILDWLGCACCHRRSPDRTGSGEAASRASIYCSGVRLAPPLLLEEIDGEPLIFLPHLRKAEEGIATRIKSLAGAEPIYPPIDFEKAVAWCERRTGKTLAPSQREALKMVLANRVVVITGGPGVGKTTLVNSILMILRAKGVKCLLCAPTGRAAKRLTETTGLEAKTIHRLLEIDPGTGRFTRNESNTLACGLLVVDETSMVDVPLMHSLVRAVPNRSGLILVGDVDQLPSVGPGTVLHDLIESGAVPTVRLTEVFRQAADSRIITNAHRIRRGQMPDMRGADPSSDFHFVERDEPEKIVATLVKLVQDRIPQRFGLDPIRDVQVLCPMKRGSLGVRELNTALRRVLNPARSGEPSVERFGWRFQMRDKVIQTENDYDKDVFNGDVGIVERVDPVEQQVAIRFDERIVKYDFGELDEVSLAYAVTIHKSQGSEFPAVVIPLATQHYMLLQRNLIYTGITRGKRLLVLIGRKKALGIAVRNDRPQRRDSGLLASLLQSRSPSLRNVSTDERSRKLFPLRAVHG